MTTQIKEFDKQNLKTLRSDVEAALAEVAKKHGITLGVANITFRADSFSAKITGATIAEGDDSDGVMSGSQMKWAQDFKSHASLFGMKHTDLGKKVTIGAFTYVIVGARPRARQNIVLQNPNGGFNVQEASIVAKFLK